MKKPFYYIIPLLLTLSCSKEMSQIANTNTISEVDSSLEAFSILLSKALYAEPELRYFVKKEALQKKDYDYDVFYPYVKDEIIDGNRTVEEILKQYDSEDILESVIIAHPLLTVLVPDWSWVNEDCFSAERWDCTIPDVGVGFLSDSEDHAIYWNGEYAFTMHSGEFCSAPILIVKDNDRLVIDVKTKCPGETSYSFFSEDFTDLSSGCRKETKAASSTYTTYTLPYEVAKETVSANFLTHRTASAYGVCNSDPRVYQRDHIYYGMTSSIDSGYVNRNYYETLYRFKLSPNAGGTFDDPIGTNTGNDYRTNNYYYEANFWGNATKLTEAQIAAKSWGEGAAELRIKVYAGQQVIKKNVSVSFADAFYVKKVELRENHNRLGALTSRTYYLCVGLSGDNDEWLEPKWINANLQLFYWDLSEYSTSYIVEFEEYDNATKVIDTEQRSYSFATNFSTTVEAGGSLEVITLKRGYGYGGSITDTRTLSNTIETTQQSDNLGNFVVQYTDKVILYSNNSTAKIKTYHTGDVDVQIIPIYE